ncbi:uncharacterized protein F5891DRAFT_1024370 [Suillus fuscotomentosus]|uniref:Uncharacterized protein n=1 Tax=Suillus fuscotomentosus TaxID=1912939 RepID=A0AAD4EAQ2_9AGAM|nr:uncharacterized protein F5891DRAFT_1024370 [Suillus fuscotomentosus]KAG1902492.1 hypothetical protein F5891DRAFT_1024370 [Suillus fuscotomentosus]
MFCRSNDIHVIASIFILVLQASGVWSTRRPILSSTRSWTTHCHHDLEMKLFTMTFNNYLHAGLTQTQTSATTENASCVSVPAEAFYTAYF